jgi:hypothetical protein
MHRFLLLLFCFFPTCVHAFWPFTWEFGGEKRFIGPMASYRSATETETGFFTVRPLLFNYSSEQGGVYEFLYPLGKSTRDKSYLVPFFLSKGLDDDHDTSFLTLFWGSSQHQSYGGLFPFYGKLYRRFSKDEIGFYLWPLYSYTESEGAVRKNFVWPIFSLYSGRETGFKVWPLYGTRQKAGERNSTFALWPFFIKEEKNLDTDEPLSNLYVFPFYAGAKSRTMVTHQVIWPLFSYSRDSEYEKWGFLFSLFSRTRSVGPSEGQVERNGGYSIFPFVSYKKQGEDTDLSILWPLYRESEWHAGDTRYLLRRVAVLNRYIEDGNGSFLNVWPFFEYDSRKEASDLLIPSFLPVRVAGIDRIIKPLYTLYEQRRRGNKRMMSVLYGFFTKEEEGEYRKTRLAFLFETKVDQEGKGFEVFSGLFGIHSKYIKILFVPFRRDG